ncbi:DUF305 domain-containing protein [Rhizobium sp. TRM95796]|uniref:DUF305 domain-containing protein n=1 Tax=Rhizobium sp. TRM95796 TaxID=2979862 RepID=UPI0021E7E0E1|nr:DUF305 domain-containing protein [Rhizobium sp. TRM95796]MCV3768712.1 DUF305 domain-containing protein [Rhizobium sp. TRM95796]
MRTKLAILSGAVAFLGLASVHAQAQEAAMPEKCSSAASAMNMPMGQMMDMPMGQIMEHMHGMELQDFNKSYKEGMRKTMPPMMQAMMAEDPDIAFVCGMIAHHMGAIEMSKTVLKYGKNEEAKAMAQKIIDAQLKEIGEMSKWVEANAK